MNRPARLLLAAPLAAALAVAGPSVALAKRVPVRHSANGKRVVLTVGQTLTVKLPANRTTPFHWVVARRPDRSVAALRGAHYRPPRHPVPGRGGSQVYRIKAVAAGKTTFRTRLRSVGRGSKFVRTYTLRLRVKE